MKYSLLVFITCLSSFSFAGEGTSWVVFWHGCENCCNSEVGQHTYYSNPVEVQNGKEWKARQIWMNAVLKEYPGANKNPFVGGELAKEKKRSVAQDLLDDKLEYQTAIEMGDNQIHLVRFRYP